MMPKGVEHTRLSKLQGWEWTVKIPMMPKGVEHEGRGAMNGLPVM